MTREEPVPAGRCISYLMKNDAHDITGVMMGRAHPPVLGVIIGVTPGETDSDLEYAKAVRARSMAVHTLTDVSTSEDTTLSERVLASLDIVFGTVTTYEIHRRILRRGEEPRWAVLSVIEDRARKGVDFVVIHASGTLEMAQRVRASTRTIPIASRGGAMMAQASVRFGTDNPYLENYDDVLDICQASGMALSLAGTYRPGTVADALDDWHRQEISLQAELVRRAQERGVKVSVELINHVPLNLIPVYSELGLEKLHGAPFGALGPTPTDIGIGYDDVVGAIGAATAAQHGTSWITCVTSGEHCHLPTIDNLTRAIKYFQIGLHVGAVGRDGDVSRDAALSVARNENNWHHMADLAIHRDDAADMFRELGYHAGQVCTMCAGACPLLRTRVDLGRPAQ